MKCPNCGAESKSSKFCEYCGSEIPQENATIYITNNYYGTSPQEQKEDFKSDKTPKKSYVPEKNRGKKTWLWVLGWIFIFPLPLTILLLRKKNMKLPIKIGIIAIAWIIYLLFAMSGDEENSSDKASTDTVVVESQDITTEDVMQNEIEQPADENTVMDNVTVYAEDEVVNRFITEFNEKSLYEISEISKGNIRTKFFGYANGRYLEMINANDAGAEAFSLTINGGQEEENKQSMFEVFKEAAKILEPSITDEEIDDAINEFIEIDLLIEDYKLGETMSVTYIPIKELSYGLTSCRIDIYAYDYK